MKKLFKNAKSKIIIVAAVLAAAVLAVGITMALYQDNSNMVVNTFTLGNVTTEIVEIFQKEDDTTYKKEPRVTNTGENDCYIRLRYQITPEEAGKRQVSLDGPGEGWKQVGDWYYYQNPVKPGESTTPLFTTVKLQYDEEDNPWIDFDILLYQEAVQTVAVNNGEKVTDMMTIWKLYDSAK